MDVERALLRLFCRDVPLVLLLFSVGYLLLSGFFEEKVSSFYWSIFAAVFCLF